MALAPNPGRLGPYVSAAAADAYVIQCATEAADMVTTAIGTNAVPASVAERAALEVGAELFHRRQSRNGIAGLDNMDFAPMRIARDPMKAAMPYLQPYLGPAVA